MTLSGFCNPSLPRTPAYDPHDRCTFDDCTCSCHTVLQPLTHPEPDPTPALPPVLPLGAAPLRGPGFHDDLDEAAYHADPHSLSHSGAKTLLKAPAIFRHEQLHPVYKKVFDFGSAAHAKVLGVGAEIRLIPDGILASNGATSTKEAKAFIAQARADGAVPLKSTEARVIDEMADKLAEHRLAMELLSEGRPEVSAYAKDPDTGVMLRCRFDWLGTTIATDYKSAASADPDWFKRKAAEFGYHQQAGWYLDVAANAGQPLDAFCFIVQMKEAPFLVTVVELVDRAVDRGRQLNRRAIETYAACSGSGVWPGYVADDRYASVDIPEWAYSDVSHVIDDDFEESA